MAEQIMTGARNWVPHPGEFIKEELEARSWNQRDLAFILGCPEQTVTMILTGKRGISPDMAKALGNAFDVAAEFFSNLQRAFELAHANEPNEGIAKRARIQSRYPVREMIKRGILDDKADASMLEVQLAKFFGVSNAVNDSPTIAHAAKRTRTSPHDDETPTPSQLVWFFRVKQIASTMLVPAYSESKLRDTLTTLAQHLEDPDGVRVVPRLLMECGVRFVLVEHFPGTGIDGVTFWLNQNAPVIGMSLRLDRIDNFWFVLRHEIEHVLHKHGQTLARIDVELDKMEQQPDEETIANSAASDFCVPRDRMNDWFARKRPLFSERDVIGFAKTMRRHPGLVIGQLQFRTKRFNLLRKHQIKIRTLASQGAIVDGWGHALPITL